MSVENDAPAWFAVALVGFLSIGSLFDTDHLIYYDESNTSYFLNVSSINETDPLWSANSSTVARNGSCSDGYAVQNTTTSGVQCIAVVSSVPYQSSAAGWVNDTNYINTTKRVRITSVGPSDTSLLVYGTSYAIQGQAINVGVGVRGYSPNNIGVVAESGNGAGLYAISAYGYGAVIESTYSDAIRAKARDGQYAFYGNGSGLFTTNLTVNGSLVCTAANGLCNSTGSGNTTEEIRNAVNNSGEYNISINASNILNPPWISEVSYQSSAAGWTNDSTSTNTSLSVNTGNITVNNLYVQNQSAFGNPVIASMFVRIAPSSFVADGAGRILNVAGNIYGNTTGLAGVGFSPNLMPEANLRVVYGTIGLSSLGIARDGIAYNITNLFTNFYRVDSGAQYSGTVARAYGYFLESPSLQNGTVTRLTGMYINNMENTRVGTAIGLGVYNNAGFGLTATQTPSAQVDINNLNASKAALEINGASSQTANLTEWRDNRGNTIASVNATGSIFDASGQVCTAANGLCNSTVSYQSSAAGWSNYTNWTATGSGVLINTTSTKPVCDANTRGGMWFEQGGVGASDYLYACMKNSTDSYNWIEVSNGG